MNVGDVNWVEFPPRDGHVQTGRRPAIIAQAPLATSTIVKALWSALDEITGRIETSS